MRTTCPYCGVGCGVLATPDGKGGAAIKGDPEHPANVGRLCSKGSALGETLGLETRLLHPIVDGRRAQLGRGARSCGRAALQHVRAEHGPEAIAFYLSGQLLTEDYYVANKLAKGFIGTPHVDTNSRLCMASSVAGHRRAFGADVVPQCYDDLELADLVVLAGSNAAWCHPVLYQRIQTARAERGMRVVNIDPRRTATSEGADLHLPIRPGTDASLWSGLLVWLAERTLIDARSSRSTRAASPGRCGARALLRPRRRCRRCHRSRPPGDRGFLRLVRQHARASSPATARASTSRRRAPTRSTPSSTAIWRPGGIGKPGSGPLSLTGQPNAMGGREVGGLANMLAAHMGFSRGRARSRAPLLERAQPGDAARA